MLYHKLSSKLTMSSLWSKPNATRILFITMLSLKDENGLVEACDSSLKTLSRLSQEEYKASIKELMAPDPDSSNQEFEGRRVGKCDLGYVVFSADRYNPNDFKYSQKESSKKVREWRRKRKEKALEGSVNQTKGVN
jgi:hypothetical protein